ncbi:hypothetical protein [Methylobacterium sp. 1030]|uniref:hypothetical protein n=1 Tax=Methylobacterium sp. 1030 TaxID=3156404 RepID=UPI003396E711
MSTASTRRAALGAILAAPLASVPATASAASATPALVRLIAKNDRINDLLNASDGASGFDPGLVRAAGVIRSRVAAFPSRGLPDILAKASCLARLYPLADAEEQVRESLNGYAFLDEMSVALAVEVMKLAEGTLCA